MDDRPPEDTIDQAGFSEFVSSKSKSRQLAYTDFSDISACLEGYDFIEGFLCKNNISVFFGPSKSGKTLFVTDMALHVALEREWFGREVDHGCVLYFSLEGQQVVMNRIAAFKKAHGIKNVKCPFRLFKGPINLLNTAEDADLIINAARQMEKEFKLPVLLIIVDTWSRANPGGKEDTEDTGRAFSRVDQIRDETRANIAIIHHTPNDGESPRGSGIMQANPDILIKISKDKQTKIGTAKTYAERDGEGEHEFHFTFEGVELGHNQRGNPVVSCIIRPTEGSPRSNRSLVNGQAKIAYDVLIRVWTQ